MEAGASLAVDTLPETPLTFLDFGLDQRLLDNLARMNFVEPTPIQASAIPVALSSRDIVGLAQTGTGKTAAFVLPMLHKMLQGKSGRKPRGLVIAPTRELAEQIFTVINQLGEGTGIRAVTIYGGASYGKQLTEMRKGVDILVVCPGRLLDHIDQRTIDLAAIELLVLDEADQMFDMGFLPSLRDILRYVPKTAQRMLFSATMPEDIRKLANDILKDPETVQVGSVAAAGTVEHQIFVIPTNLKMQALLKIIDMNDKDTVLIFARTKQSADSLADMLARQGRAVTALHGDLSQPERAAALEGFKQGEHRILVATDIAARGIDVSEIGRVINYDMPNTVEGYIHRTGRTGRAEFSGIAISLVTPTDAASVRAIERTAKCDLKRMSLPGFTSPELERFIEIAPSSVGNGVRSRLAGRGRQGGGGRDSGGRGGRGGGGRRY